MICLQCGRKFRGRSDKKYCSLPCKNAYHRLRKEPQLEIIKQVDKILHRNHSILSQLPWDDKKSLTLPQLDLKNQGFHFDFHTGIFINKHDQTFFYIYNYAWIALTKNRIYIIRK